MYTTIPGLTIRRAGGGEVELFATVKEARLNSFSSIEHRENYGNFNFQYFNGNGFQIWYSSYLMKSKMHFVSSGDMEVLELHIPLVGEFTTWWDGHRQHQLRRLQFDMEYAPFIQSETVFAAGQKCETIDFHYSTEFITQFSDRFPVVNNFLNQVEQRQRASLLQRAVRFLNPAMMQVVQNILRYPGTSAFAAMYYEQQATILLELVLARAMNMRHDYSTKKDIEACVAIRDLIEKNPQHLYTTEDFSRHMGINVSRLHKSFKELHGATPYDFGQGVRLEHAKRLLLETSLPVNEIAAQCGYNEHPNFTAAFRKRFGFSPQRFRETGNSVRFQSHA